MFPTLVVALALFQGPALGATIPKASFELKLDNYEIHTEDYRFPSGLRVLFQEDHTQPIVSITNWIGRGSLHDGTNAAGESTEGVAHAVEHVAFRARHDGTLKNWDIINQLGGELNASTSKEWTNYMTVAPVDAAIPLLRIEALRLARPVEGVTSEDVEAEKSIVRNELRMGYEMGSNGSPAIRTALLYVPQLLFPPDHPYRNSTIGSHETISHIDLGTVQRFTRENYTPENSTIAVVGDFKLEGGRGMVMIFDAFQGVEDMLMAPEDAQKYRALTTQDDKDKFLEAWLPKLQAFLQTTLTTPAQPRVDCAHRAEPPPPFSKEVMHVKGMVDNPTAIVAWSLPGGYCDDDPQLEIAANLLTSYIYRTIDPSYDPLSQKREIEGIGCFPDVDVEATTMVCMVEKGKLGNTTPDKLIEKVGDALYLQWAPIEPAVKPFYDNAFAEARLSAMADVLGQTDNVANLYGRSYFISQHAHYTGSPNFFSDSIQSYNSMQLEPVRKLAQKYLTRDRMVAVVIEPMDDEDKEQLEASSSEADKSNTVGNEHRAKEDRSRQLFSTDMLTPEAIKNVAVVPDVGEMRVVDLDNGLKVVLMDHGEAPLVKVGLRVFGGNADAPVYGLDTLANALYETAETSDTDPTQNPLAVAGSVGMLDNDTLYATGSSGNLDALLEKVRWNTEDYDWTMADKAGHIKGWANTARTSGEKPEAWASRLRYERLFPGSPYGTWLTPQQYQDLSGVGLDQVKSWIFTKWQPKNAYLVVVGKITDMDAAETLVHKYFDSWQYRGAGTPGEIPPVAAPQSQPDRQVLLFDKPIATQSKVQLSCQLKRDGNHDDARTEVLGSIFTFLAFERLREEKGLTYGAYAYPRMYRGDTTELIISSVIQNSGAAYGAKTMMDLVAEGAGGEIDQGLIATSKWNVARTLVTGQQSGDQMLSTILGADRDHLDYFSHMPDDLANVDAAGLKDALSTCSGHEIVTVIGPVDEIKPQFDQAGIPYEVVDWKKLQENLLSPKELKAWKKSEAKKADDAAKKKATEGAGDGSSDGSSDGRSDGSSDGSSDAGPSASDAG